MSPLSRIGVGLIVGTTAIAVQACAPGGIADPEEGHLDVHLHVPDSDVVVGADGRHVRVSDLEVTLGTPRLHASACPPAGCSPAEVHEDGQVFLPAGNTEIWATFELPGSQVPADGYIEWETAPSPPPFRIAGVYNEAITEGEGLFELAVARQATFDLPVPRPVANETKARVRVILDPAEWLYDPESGEVAPLEDLVPRPPGDQGPWGAVLREEMDRSIRLQAF